MSRTLKAHVLLIAVVMVWGSTFVLIKTALQDISTLLFLTMRMAIAAVALGLFYRRHMAGIQPAALARGIVTGIFLALAYILQTAGLRLTTPSKSAFLTGLTVVFVPLLLAVPRLRTRGSHAPRWNAWLGALAAFAGIVLLTAPRGRGLGSVNRGDLLTLACALAFSGHILCLAHFSPRMRFEQLAVVQMSAATVFLALAMPLFALFFGERIVFHATPAVFYTLLVTGLLATAVAFTVQSWAQQFLPPTHTTLIFTLEPVFAWITAYLFLGERLDVRSSIGALLILAGIAVTELFNAPPLEIEAESTHVLSPPK